MAEEAIISGQVLYKEIVFMKNFQGKLSFPLLGRYGICANIPPTTKTNGLNNEKTCNEGTDKKIFY